MENKKLVLSAFAVCVLLTASLAMVLSVEEDGSEETLYVGATDFRGYTPIRNVQELSDIRNDLSGKYYLANDIIFGDGSGSNFTPIGTGPGALSFRGIFDGNGHVIIGLRTEATSSVTYSGLFGYVSGGEIRNLGVVNGYSTAKLTSAYVGGIIGYSSSSSVINCYNTGTVTASSTSSSAYAGGIIGYSSSSSVINCYNTGAVTSSAHAGGIIGYSLSSSPVINCYNTGSVSASSSLNAYAGGIVGNSSSPVINCYNGGSVSASSSYRTYAGGIIGYSLSSLSPAINCYNTGTVTASGTAFSAYAGGITGYFSYSSIINCYNSGSVSASSSGTTYAGGITGQTSSAIANCYNTGSVSASATSYDSRAYAGGITGQTSSTITNCYNTASVTASSESSNAYVGGIIGYSSSSSIINCYNTGSVSASSPYSVHAGGIIGGALSSAIIINCYYLEGQRNLNGSSAADALCSSGSPNIDGASSPSRSTSPDQRSSTAKTIADMKPSFSAVVANNSIYFTGTTNLIDGWDFNTTWIIDGSINNGLPTLRPYTATSTSFTVSGQITKDGIGTAGMRIIYTIDGGSPQTAVTDVNGYYTITAQIGDVVRIIKFELSGYNIDVALPSPYIYDKTANFTWTPDTSKPDTTEQGKTGGSSIGLPVMIAIGAAVGGLGGAVCYFVFRKR